MTNADKIYTCDEIVQNVINHNSDYQSNLGLYTSGGLGTLLLSIYNQYLNNHSRNEEFIHYSLHNISLLLDEPNNTPYFGTGYCGLGWVLNHIEKFNFLEIKSQSALSQIDKIAVLNSLAELKKKNNDFIYGPVGNLFYLIDRINQNEVKSNLQTIINELINLSLKNKKGGYYWMNDEYNAVYTGLAHGQASKIVLFSKLLMANIQTPHVREVLIKSIDYLLSTKKKSENGSLYPSGIRKNDFKDPSRLAWCTGDLCIGISLLSAAEALSDSGIRKMALDILLHTLKRKNKFETEVIDASICHGSAGLALIYNRIYRLSGNEKFKIGSDYWIQRTIDFSNDKSVGKNYRTWSGKMYGWISDNGLLTGSSGVALSLLSIQSDKKYDWDSCLLLQ